MARVLHVPIKEDLKFAEMTKVAVRLQTKMSRVLKP